MAKAFKRLLSGSTDGLPITVAATATPGTLIHTANSGTTVGSYDEVWMWAYNIHSSDLVITIELGTDVRPIVLTIPSKVGLVPIIPGLVLQNSKVIRVFAASTNLIMITGFVNHIQD